MTDIETWIRGATVVTPAGPARLDVGIADGRIVALTAPGQATHVEAETVDATDGLLVPGMIDAHVHFNEPGRTHWEGFATGSRAAAAGGVTTIFDMPLNSSPATLTPEAFREKQALAAARSIVNVRLWGGLTPANLDQLEALHACGVVGFKAFMSSSGIDDFPRADDETLCRGMKIVARLPGMRVAVHAEDEALTARLAAEARAAGRIDVRAFCESRPIEAELRAIRRVIELSGETGCPVHVVHVSSAAGLALITEAKARGVDVTAETCPHYLTLDEDSMVELGAVAKCAPPLRNAIERERLWDALRRGEVDTIGSDHSPCPPEMKQAGLLEGPAPSGPLDERTTRRSSLQKSADVAGRIGSDFFAAWGGIPGVQHALPLVYSEAATRGVPPGHVANMLSAAPSRLFGLEHRTGRIEAGLDADLCLLAPAHGLRISADELLYRHRLSPYIGRSLHWKVATTWVRGRVVFSASRGD